jgi:hypothetical protein
LSLPITIEVRRENLKKFFDLQPVEKRDLFLKDLEEQLDLAETFE